MCSLHEAAPAGGRHLSRSQVAVAHAHTSGTGCKRPPCTRTLLLPAGGFTADNPFPSRYSPVPQPRGSPALSLSSSPTKVRRGSWSALQESVLRRLRLLVPARVPAVLSQLSCSFFLMKQNCPAFICRLTAVLAMPQVSGIQGPEQRSPGPSVGLPVSGLASSFH